MSWTCPPVRLSAKGLSSALAITWILSSLEPYLPWLDDQRSRGFHNAACLWRSAVPGVSMLNARGRRAGDASAPVRERLYRNLERLPSARVLSKFMTTKRDSLSKANSVTVTAIETDLPSLVELGDIIASFHRMLRRKGNVGLTPWIERARSSLASSFASCVAKDENAVRAAITSD